MADLIEIKGIKSFGYHGVFESENIAERGTHDELIEAKGRYYDLYTYQAKI